MPSRQLISYATIVGTSITKETDLYITTKEFPYTHIKSGRDFSIHQS